MGGLVRYPVCLFFLQVVTYQQAMNRLWQIILLTGISVSWWAKRMWWALKMTTNPCSEASVMKRPFSNIVIGSITGTSCFGWGWKHQKNGFPPWTMYLCAMYLLWLVYWFVLTLAVWKQTATLFCYCKSHSWSCQLKLCKQLVYYLDNMIKKLLMESPRSWALTAIEKEVHYVL